MNIKIKSLDTHGQNYEKNFKLKKKLDLEDKKEYYYNDEYGKNKIIIRYDFVEILRQGIINSKQIFKLEKETSFTYITKEFKGKYIIFTKKMTINDLKILLEYDIMDKNEIINSIKLEISNF
ncbi:MAG: DUF1934 family protein [Leptotrichiaceae bacterium]|nr:DUF1934 family protein [Leptotrichiaceae bacterium]MBP6281570.1 DUF1934 family protein [Leptotrichiaceae bacterium]MBP7101296.1 DUF1934 family protein [Leptotrichiaceae bacterium]MBP7739648.1 DUF1934 family protein [Leptotrichiaceae bacterium]MBP9630482.1 DUF1934 family protein [Leptotrichiaceae bacterium]